MPKTISKQDNNVKKILSEWDITIRDVKRRIARLQAALSHAEEMKAAGEPWPGTQVHRQTRKPCHVI